jgi:hypothetical protein
MDPKSKRAVTKARKAKSRRVRRQRSAIREGSFARAALSSTSQVVSLPTKFEKFPNLPIEIQRKIWTYLEPKPLIIAPKSNYSADAFCLSYWRKVPILLQICKATREEYLAKEGVTKGHITFTLCRGISKLPFEVSIYVALDYDLVVVQENCVGEFDIVADIVKPIADG